MLPSERENPPRPELAAAAGDRDVERRLRTLASACAAPAAAALVAAGTIGWMAMRGAGSGGIGDTSGPGNPGNWQASPPSGSFLAAVGAMLLVLLASAAHGRILRRPGSDGSDGFGGSDGLDGSDRSDGSAGSDRAGPAVWVAERLSAYSWATGVAFAMLAAAVALGAALALGGKAPFYGLVICLASLAVMAARWPRRATFDLALTRASRQEMPAETTDGTRPGP
jgi:hypothetical protein